MHKGAETNQSSMPVNISCACTFQESRPEKTSSDGAIVRINPVTDITSIVFLISIPPYRAAVPALFF